MSNTFQILNIVSRFVIAIAIIYFAYQLSRVVDNLPVIEQSLSHVSQQVPPVVEEVEQVRLEITAIRQQIPQVLSVAEQAVATANNAEKKITKMLPEVLTEIRLTREKIDPTLNRVDVLIDKASTKVEDAISKAEGAGQEASEGAITGLLSGILKLPFNLIGTLASPILTNIEPDITKQLTQKDIKLMGEAGKHASKSQKLEEAHQWNNPESGNSGAITILRRFELEQEYCVKVKININKHGSSIMEKIENFCRNKDGKWELLNISDD